MNEAERCDRISLMHAGRVLVSDTPAALIAASAARDTLEEAFIGYLEEARRRQRRRAADRRRALSAPVTLRRRTAPRRHSSACGACSSYTRREALELRRDPMRATLALLGTRAS